jgi:hypothetical protein
MAMEYQIEAEILSATFEVLIFYWDLPDALDTRCENTSNNACHGTSDILSKARW